MNWNIYLDYVKDNFENIDGKSSNSPLQCISWGVLYCMNFCLSGAEVSFWHLLFSLYVLDTSRMLDLLYYI